MAQKPISATELENAAEALKHNTLYDNLFSGKNKSKYEEYCNKVFDVADKKNDEAKGVCHKLAFFLEKIAVNPKKEERDKHCNYLPYWLYGEIGKIYKKEKSIKLGKIPFFNDLISAKNNIYSKIEGNKCSYLLFDSNTSLDELIKQKISFIYFNKYNDIKKDVTVSPNKDKCKKYSTYLDLISSFYKIIEKGYCMNRWFLSPPVPKYFNCDKNLNPESLLSTAKQCAAKEPGSGGGLGANSLILSLFGWGGSSTTTSSGNGRGVEAQDSRNDAHSAKDRGKAAKTDSSGDGDSKDLANSLGTGREASSEKAVSLPGSGLGAGRGPSNHVGLRGPQHQAGREAMSQSGVMLSTVGQLSNGNNGGLFADHGILNTVVIGEVLDSSNIFQKISEVLKSDYFRHLVTGASAIGVLIFLIYFFRVITNLILKCEYFVSTAIGSKSNKRDKTKRERENNYYDAYEEDFSRYGSEHSVEDSEMSDVHLSYQPRRDSYY
ncbi:CYIR protein [Plasmodium cynomolgi strain B]|uniref:CYIR protein n=1 Tax=Plasmodium cynomolgi (strain B) TaxID=1120755 RepID=K6UNC9_PLACD|nr:CYIR protein [Plasmodium cynomolgi strain B]GAB69373.1 CYIR protein [Plasmodium cynomolgi strain B]